MSRQRALRANRSRWTGIFADLRMPADDLGRLVESLRFNGYLDADGGYVDKRALLGLRPDDLNLAPEFLRTSRPSWTRSRRGSRLAEARPAW